MQVNLNKCVQCHQFFYVKGLIEKLNFRLIIITSQFFLFFYLILLIQYYLHNFEFIKIHDIIIEIIAIQHLFWVKFCFYQKNSLFKTNFLNDIRNLTQCLQINTIVESLILPLLLMVNKGSSLSAGSSYSYSVNKTDQ